LPPRLRAAAPAPARRAAPPSESPVRHHGRATAGGRGPPPTPTGTAPICSRKPRRSVSSSAATILPPRSRGVARDVAVVVPSFAAAAAIVAGTDLVASLPDSLVQVLGPRLALRRVATPLAPVTSTIKLLWHERTHQDPALQAFRELLARAAGQEGLRPRPVPL